MTEIEAEKLDVVITFHPKDWPTLEWCINGIRKNINAGDIYVISRKTEKQRLEALKLIFIDEDTVIPGLTAGSFKNERWGWYFQQIIKLGMAKFIKSKYYLVVDADTVFLRKVKFFKEGKPLYATSNEYTPQYLNSFYQLLGFHPDREFSFITHHMLFNTYIVNEMITRFQSNSEWWSPVVRLASNGATAFSEFETYGHYIKAMHKSEFVIRNLAWRNVPFFRLMLLCFCSLYGMTIALFMPTCDLVPILTL